MQSTNTVFQRLQSILETCGTCPVCGEPLYRPKVAIAGREVPGACPACGYKTPTGVENKRNPKEWQLSAQKKAANAYLVGNSLTPSGRAFSNTFETYVAKTPEEKKALAFAHEKVDTLVDQPPAHVYFTGPAGSGKTHLATAILLDYIVRRNYLAKALYVDWGKLSTMYSGRFNLQPDVQAYLTRLMDGMQTCDLLLLDDFGAEVYNGTTTKAPVDLANTIFNSRVDKNLIITTNLTGEMIKEAYTQRIVSRMNAHVSGNAMLFAGIRDHRATA